MESPHHRRIDLQSPSDLLYLRDNIRRAAAAKLDLAFPPTAAPEHVEEDALRQKVEALVQEYITQTLSLALPSLTVNGLDAPSTLLQQNNPSNITSNNQAAEGEDANETYEPYDPRLATHLRTLYATLESESTRVAQLRRSAPTTAATTYISHLQSELQSEREATQRLVMEADGKGVKGEGEGEDGIGKVGLIGGLERREEVERMWGRGVEGLVGLEGVTEVVARLERAGRAVGEVEGL